MLTRLHLWGPDDTLHSQHFPSLPEMSRLQQAFALVPFVPPPPNAQLPETLPPSVQPCCLCWNARIANESNTDQCATDVCSPPSPFCWRKVSVLRRSVARSEVEDTRGPRDWELKALVHGGGSEHSRELIGSPWNVV